MGISPITIIAVLLLGVLFFGKNLPQVAQQIGSALLEFRKGINEWKENIVVNPKSAAKTKEQDDSVEAPTESFVSTGTKFVPPEKR
jgi:Sec-independent protein translocase protein TatA